MKKHLIFIAKSYKMKKETKDDIAIIILVIIGFFLGCWFLTISN